MRRPRDIAVHVTMSRNLFYTDTNARTVNKVENNQLRDGSHTASSAYRPRISLNKHITIISNDVKQKMVVR